jgi:peptide/nickel transport system substrate-binding protein
MISDSSLRRLSFAAFVALSAGCTSSAQRGAGERPLEVVVSTEVQTLDPRFSTRSLDVKVTRLVHAGLFGLDPDTLEPVPLAAEHAEWVDPRTLRVTLRRGVRFHGGRLLGVADVCATLEAVRDPALGSPSRSVVDSIGGCVEAGEGVVEISLARPRATLLSDLEIPILRADEARSPPAPDGRLDGLGPFAIVNVRPGEVTLAPANDSVLPRPRHAVVVRTVRDENARVQRLLSGRSDVAPNAISPSLLPAIEGRTGLEVVSRPGANVTYLMFQNDRAPFDAVEVRRAVSAAIDRGAIVRTLLAGRATIATGLLPPGHWAAPDAGFPTPPGAAGALRDLPTVELLASTDRPRVVMARAVAQMLGDAGLSTVVVPLDLGVLLARLDAGDFDLAMLQIPELTEPNVLSWFFHPKGVPGEGGQGRNRSRYRSAAAGNLFDAASAVTGRDVRRGLYTALAAQMASDVPVIPLWHEEQVAVVSERARGFRPSAEGHWTSLARLE